MLFLYEAVDEYVMSNLREYKEKTLVSADQGDLKLGDAPKPNDESSLSEDESKNLALVQGNDRRSGQGSKISTRLVDSPSMALSPDAMSSQMRRMMRQMGQDSGMPNEVLFEINPGIH